MKRQLFLFYLLCALCPPVYCGVYQQLMHLGVLSSGAFFSYAYMHRVAHSVVKNELQDVDPTVNAFFKNRFKDIPGTEKIILKRGSISSIKADCVAFGNNTVYISDACHSKMLQEPSEQLEKFSSLILHEWQHLNNNDFGKNATMHYISNLLGIMLVTQQASCYAQWNIKNVGLSMVTLPLYFMVTSKLFNSIKRHHERNADKFACKYSSVQELEYFKRYLHEFSHDEQRQLLWENWWAFVAFMWTSDDMDLEKWLTQHPWLHKYLKTKFKYIDYDHPLIEDRIDMINKAIKDKTMNV